MPQQASACHPVEGLFAVVYIDQHMRLAYERRGCLKGVSFIFLGRDLTRYRSHDSILTHAYDGYLLVRLQKELLAECLKGFLACRFDRHIPDQATVERM